VPIKKQQILKQIVASLSESLDNMTNAARAAHAEATHESSKAENKYDTRGLEAAYLAGGQARQAREVADAIEAFNAMDLRDFKPGEPIDLGALVELENDGERSLFFIGPKSGGLEIIVQKQEITVITPQSPLGQNLEGRKTGDRWKAQAGLRADFHIVSVC
jgi:transcription elongation GreA/GreB family factor